MAVADTTLEGVSEVKNFVLTTYKGRDLGASNTFLGMRIDRDRVADTWMLSCPGGTAALLEQYGMGAARPNKLPMPAKTTLMRTGEQLLTNGTPHAELFGSILYLSTTSRPNIAHAAGLLARYMTNPEDQHWQAAKGIFRYLAGTPDYGLRYGASKALAGAVDADFGGCPETRRSTSGWLFTWNGAAFSWGSKRQLTVSSSTAEAEYMAAATATREALCVRKQMKDLGQPAETVNMTEDNQACLALIANPETNGRAKHIDIAHHMVRERAAMAEVKFTYTPGVKVLADGLTKAMPNPACTSYRSRLGVCATGATAPEVNRTA